MRLGVPLKEAYQDSSNAALVDARRVGDVLDAAMSAIHDTPRSPSKTWSSVAKRVLDRVGNRTSDLTKIFNQEDYVAASGRVTAPQLQKRLRQIGVELNDTEADTLMAAPESVDFHELMTAIQHVDATTAVRVDSAIGERPDNREQAISIDAYDAAQHPSRGTASPQGMRTLLAQDKVAKRVGARVWGGNGGGQEHDPSATRGERGSGGATGAATHNDAGFDVRGSSSDPTSSNGSMCSAADLRNALFDIGLPLGDRDFSHVLSRLGVGDSSSSSIVVSQLRRGLESLYPANDVDGILSCLGSSRGDPAAAQATLHTGKRFYQDEVGGEDGSSLDQPQKGSNDNSTGGGETQRASNETGGADRADGADGADGTDVAGEAWTLQDVLDMSLHDDATTTRPGKEYQPSLDDVAYGDGTGADERYADERYAVQPPSEEEQAAQHSSVVEDEDMYVASQYVSQSRSRDGSTATTDSDRYGGRQETAALGASSRRPRSDSNIQSPTRVYRPSCASPPPPKDWCRDSTAGSTASGDFYNPLRGVIRTPGRAGGGAVAPATKVHCNNEGALYADGHRAPPAAAVAEIPRQPNLAETSMPTTTVPALDERTERKSDRVVGDRVVGDRVGDRGVRASRRGERAAERQPAGVGGERRQRSASSTATSNARRNRRGANHEEVSGPEEFDNEHVRSGTRSGERLHGRPDPHQCGWWNGFHDGARRQHMRNVTGESKESVQGQSSSRRSQSQPHSRPHRQSIPDNMRREDPTVDTRRPHDPRTVETKARKNRSNSAVRAAVRPAQTDNGGNGAAVRAGNSTQRDRPRERPISAKEDALTSSWKERHAQANAARGRTQVSLATVIVLSCSIMQRTLSAHLPAAVNPILPSDPRFHLITVGAHMCPRTLLFCRLELSSGGVVV